MKTIIKKISPLLLPLCIISFISCSGSKRIRAAKESYKTEVACSKAEKLSKLAEDLSSTDPKKAEKILNRAINMCNKSASLHFNLAIVLYNMTEYDKAETELNKSLEQNPDNAKALNALAFLNIRRQDGDPDLAVSLAQKAILLDKDRHEYQDTLDIALQVVNIDYPPETEISRPDAIAVVIGNKNYLEKSLPSVSYAWRDASTIKNI